MVYFSTLDKQMCFFISIANIFFVLRTYSLKLNLLYLTKNYSYFVYEIISENYKNRVTDILIYIRLKNVGSFKNKYFIVVIEMV